MSGVLPALPSAAGGNPHVDDVDATYNWRVTVVSERWQQRVTLYLLTPTAEARQAYDLAVAVVKSWPPGTRIVEIVPTERSFAQEDM
jgi:hypothetical protein